MDEKKMLEAAVHHSIQTLGQQLATRLEVLEKNKAEEVKGLRQNMEHMQTEMGGAIRVVVEKIGEMAQERAREGVSQPPPVLDDGTTRNALSEVQNTLREVIHFTQQQFQAMSAQIMELKQGAARDSPPGRGGPKGTGGNRCPPHKGVSHRAPRLHRSAG